MKGPTTAPCARIKSPPMSTVTMMIGSSQNLRSAPRNLHIWKTISIAFSLEKVLEAVVGRARGLAPFPVRRRRRVEAARQRVALREAHDERHRREHAEEDDPHHDRAHHAVEKLAELHPGVLERREPVRARQRDDG